VKLGNALTGGQPDEVAIRAWWRPGQFPWVALPMLGAVAVLVLPTLDPGPSILRQVELIAMFALVVVGLNLSWGYAGELALGNVAMFATGAYTTGLLAKTYQQELLVTLLASLLGAAFVGFISGVPGLRLGGWALAMSSFILVILLPDITIVFQDQTGGLNGLSAIPDPVLFGHKLDPLHYYYVVVICTILGFAFFRNLIVSRHGRAFSVLRQGPILAQSLGISVYRMKLIAYVLAGLPAGAAGALFAYLDNFIAPESFGFSTTIAFLAASVLGGSRTVYGALLGSALLQLGPLSSTSFRQYSLLVYGAFLVVGGVLLSGGLGGLMGTLYKSFSRAWVKRKAPVRVRVTTVDLGKFEGAPLKVTNVSKRFGGVQALLDVTLNARSGQVTGLIGANGSGKTTLINLVCGYYRLDKGQVELGETSLIGKRPHVIARAGVSRSFQTPSIPTGLNCLEAVATNRYVRDASGILAAVFRLPSYRRKLKADVEESQRLLDALGIGHLSSVEAASVPLGTRRLLEVARALAGRPAVVLLDEPASGLDNEEVKELSALIRRIAAAGATVVLIEHNFPMVLETADHIYVLEQGKLIADGDPEAVRANPVVIHSYLGAEAVATA
jgi:branched-chain amino acid transport system permease protein